MRYRLRSYELLLWEIWKRFSGLVGFPEGPIPKSRPNTVFRLILDRYTRDSALFK